PDVPSRGTYLFENPGGAGPGRKFPVFLPPRRLGPGYTNIRPSYVGGDARRASVRLLTPAAGLHWDGDQLPALGGATPIYPTADLVGPGSRLRANQWQLADFDGDGTRTAPGYAAGRRLLNEAGAPVAMHLQMIVPVAVDWDGDGDTDLVVGDEDGRVALVEHTGTVVDGTPRFRPPVYFQQRG